MKEKGKHSAKMPQDHKEMAEGKLGHTSNLKYSGEMSAPKDYDKANEGLAAYVRKHQMKY